VWGNFCGGWVVLGFGVVCGGGGGGYTELFYAVIPTLLPLYFMLFSCPYILLHSPVLVYTIHVLVGVRFHERRLSIVYPQVPYNF